MPKCFAEHQMTIRYDFQPSLVSINLIKKRTVNPYVTGSSPVARAKDFPQDFHSLWDFFIVCRPHRFYAKMGENCLKLPRRQNKIRANCPSFYFKV